MSRAPEKQALVEEALALSRRLWEIKADLKPADLTVEEGDTIACRLSLFQTDAIGCWADYRTPGDIMERYDGKVSFADAVDALADAQASEALSDDIHYRMGDAIHEIRKARKEASR